MYILYKVLSKLFGNKMIVKYYRKLGIVIGDNTHVFSRIITSEPYLISIGNNTTISTNVTLLTHDSSIGPIVGRDVSSDLVGKISIGDNCFIGDGAIIMYGVSICDKVIVAAGSVVTKNINKEGVIVGGNPARIIGDIDSFMAKNEKKFLKLHGKTKKEKKHEILKCERYASRKNII